MMAAINAATIAIVMAGCGMADDPQEVGLPDAIRATADRLQISPHDLLTVISYETGGRMSPSIWGGTGGKHLGLIQFSPDNQQKYGVHDKQTAPEQMQAVESYLRDRGVKPGMGLLDLYSTVNAGRPGLYNRSDANNGGAPGTVADKVAGMAPHRVRAQIMLDGKLPAAFMAPVQASGGSEATASMSPPMGFSPAGDRSPDPAHTAMQRMAMAAQEGSFDPPAPMDFSALQQHIARARALARMSMPNGEVPQ